MRMSRRANGRGSITALQARSRQGALFTGRLPAPPTSFTEPKPLYAVIWGKLSDVKFHLVHKK
jgi:hypothetical protein